MNAPLQAIKVEDAEMANSQTQSDSHSESSSKDSGKSKEVRLPFPCKVYDMLEDADRQGFEHIVSWNSDGAGFMVHKKELFTKEIVPLYFNQTKYKSFQRQLSLYGFQRIASGKNKGLRYHESLRRGSRELCRDMKPVGYKPRGLEKRENRQKHSSIRMIPSTVHVTGKVVATPSKGTHQPSLPAVVSSNSLYKDEKHERASTVSPELPPLKETPNFLPQNLVSTDDIVFFEGMPFHLMGIASEPKPEPAPQPSFETLPAALANGQLQKAWEIGFKVAMTMNASSFPVKVDTSFVDALDFHTTNVVVSS